MEHLTEKLFTKIDVAQDRNNAVRIEHLAKNCAPTEITTNGCVGWCLNVCMCMCLLLSECLCVSWPSVHGESLNL